MIELAPPTGGLASSAIRGMLEALQEGRNPLPRCVLVEDGSDSWQRHAALLPVEDRRRSVIAASSSASLVDALRFEIGGATWQPVSTPSLELACRAAATGDRLKVAPLATRPVVETALADATDLSLVGWWPRAFWNHQVGSYRLSAWLTEIAERLECLSVILPGPVLMVAGRERVAIEAVWVDDDERSSSVFPAPPTIVNLSTPDRPKNHRVTVEDVLAGLVGEGWGEQKRSDLNLPVLELPSGRGVGRWSTSTGAAARGSGWLAVPAEQCKDGSSWNLVHEDGTSEIVVETISPSDPEGDGQSVIRVPGWIGAELRRGRPAGLLVEKLVRYAIRVGRQVWVPSVDAEGVRFLLTLPGPIWVDGPGVPG